MNPELSHALDRSAVAQLSYNKLNFMKEQVFFEETNFTFVLNDDDFVDVFYSLFWEFLSAIKYRLFSYPFFPKVNCGNQQS